MIPFLTEEVWQMLGKIAPQRGIATLRDAEPSIMVAPWPEADTARQDDQIEAQFACFQDVLKAVREIRSRQNVPPKKEIEFSVRCEASYADLVRPLEPYFVSLAAARATAWGPETVAPALSVNVTLTGVEVFVDLADLIDVEAEISRKQDEVAKLEKLVAGKKGKLANANFVERAPEAVVQKERDALADLEAQLAAAQSVLEKLRERK
jgi:valyl-tRNA synthetase